MMSSVASLRTAARTVQRVHGSLPMRRRSCAPLGSALLRRRWGDGEAAAAVVGASNTNVNNSITPAACCALHSRQQQQRRQQQKRQQPQPHRRKLGQAHSFSGLPREQHPRAFDNASSCGIGGAADRCGAIRPLSSRTNKGRNKRAASAAPPHPAAAVPSNGSSTETTETVITMDGVSKQLPGGRQLFADASLTFMRGAKIGVLGVNGSGKSTVLKIIAGEGQRHVVRSRR